MLSLEIIRSNNCGASMMTSTLPPDLQPLQVTSGQFTSVQRSEMGFKVADTRGTAVADGGDLNKHSIEIPTSTA